MIPYILDRIGDIKLFHFSPPIWLAWPMLFAGFFMLLFIVLVSVGVVKGFRPRELDKKQKSILEEELRKGIHKDVAVGIYTSDAVRDGAGYAADFESVFKKAGWYAFRASDPYDERDYENGVVLIGKGTGEPPTIDVLKEVFTKSGIKVETERTERSTIELKIGKDT